MAHPISKSNIDFLITKFDLILNFNFIIHRIDSFSAFLLDNYVLDSAVLGSMSFFGVMFGRVLIFSMMTLNPIEIIIFKQLLFRHIFNQTFNKDLAKLYFERYIIDFNLINSRRDFNLIKIYTKEQLDFIFTKLFRRVYLFEKIWLYDYLKRYFSNLTLDISIDLVPYISYFMEKYLYIGPEFF